MQERDCYSTLGVLPGAEDVVISAAYRALAQRYHPDRWRGDPATAHARMVELNRAYETLRDPAHRATYDRARRTEEREPFDRDEAGDFTDAFSSALSETEARWKIACSIYPDLVNLRGSLTKVSANLAFAFVTQVLELRAFEGRIEIARKMESMFLERYFGTDPAVVAYAKTLILAGHRDAAKALNTLVDVMGSNVDASLLVGRIDQDFGLRQKREQEAAERNARDRLRDVADHLKLLRQYGDAKFIAEHFGHQVDEIGGGWLADPSIRLKTPAGQELSFKRSPMFVQWVLTELCPRL
jgi:hypothetical protein